MHAGHSTVLIGRRYLERGFLDVAMRLFVRNAAMVEKRDWALLVERLMDRHRIVDAVRACEIGGVPVPRVQLLALGDGSLRRKDFERQSASTSSGTPIESAGRRWSTCCPPGPTGAPRHRAGRAVPGQRGAGGRAAGGSGQLVSRTPKSVANGITVDYPVH